MIKSQKIDRVYIGYTVNFPRRLRQHNREIEGGAKKSNYGRPWSPICIIEGFESKSDAMKFEYKMQHGKKKEKNISALEHYVKRLKNVINSNSSVQILTIYWYIDYYIVAPYVININVLGV